VINITAICPDEGCFFDTLDGIWPAADPHLAERWIKDLNRGDPGRPTFIGL
jgi:hypothetical protein